MLVAEWARGAGEAVRVTLDDINGWHVLVARIWRLDGEHWIPGAASITLATLDFDRLGDILLRSEAQARELGLGEGVGL